MKICHILDDSIYRMGGVQQYIINIAKLALDDGLEVVIIHSANAKIHEKEIDPRLKVIALTEAYDIPGLDLNGSVSTFQGFASKRKIASILENEAFDVLHFHYPFSPFFSGRIISIANTLKKRPKLVCSFLIHSEEKFIARIANKSLGIFSKSYLNKIDLFLNISAMTKEYGLKYVHKNSQLLPVPLKSINIEEKLKVNKQRIKILFLGRLEKRKGVLDLIEALHLVNKNIRLQENAEIVIAGNGPELEAAKALAKDYDLSINFPGRVSDEERDKLYFENDIAVFPAKYGESFGVVLIEAMNYGCAITGYANPGYTDTLGPYKKECLVEVNDIQALAEKITLFIKDKNHLQQVKMHLKEYFERNFENKIVLNKLIEVYKTN